MNILQAERVELALKEIGLPVSVEYKGNARQWVATITYSYTNYGNESATGASSVSMIDAIECAITGYRNRE